MRNQATVMVHEACLWLVRDEEWSWDGLNQFFYATADLLTLRGQELQET